MVGRKAEIIENYNFICSANLSKFEGKWIAIVDEKVVAVDDSIKKVYAITKDKYPDKDPLFDKVVGKQTLIV
jgi:hypothetical protein